ncbi:MAG: hypothetical protein ACYC26_11690 [Phycisphaerales bacterium]
MKQITRIHLTWSFVTVAMLVWFLMILFRTADSKVHVLAYFDSVEKKPFNSDTYELHASLSLVLSNRSSRRVTIDLSHVRYRMTHRQTGDWSEEDNSGPQRYFRGLGLVRLEPMETRSFKYQWIGTARNGDYEPTVYDYRIE